MRLKPPDDTIAAVSTAAGEGGIGVVRLSGSGAIAVADRVFKPKSGVAPSRQTSHTVQYGDVIDPSTLARADEAMLLVMRSPKTFTREDMAEISCHGGQIAVQKVLEACLSAGARAAEPGEFTKRAFLSGRIDLAQAEAVLDVIRAKTEDAYRAAQTQLEGVFSKKILELRDEMASLLSHMEASIDFPDDRIDPMAAEALRSRLKDLERRMEQILAASKSGLMVRDGLKAVLIGRPNVGKSSLMNALAKTNRVIVSPTPGTTRDTVEECVQIRGLAVRLVDTAGLQKTDCGIEQEGIRRAKKEIESASLVLYVVDGSRRPEEEDRQIFSEIGARPKFMIINKADVMDRGAEAEYRAMESSAAFATSCLKGLGLELLENAVAAFALKDAPATEEPWICSVRHRDLFARSLAHVRLAAQAYDERLSAEFPASDLQRAMEALGEIVGEVVTDDILELIFNQFCIGK